jgi:hypothetical protein
MISYTKNIEQENEFIQSSISIDSNTEENNILLTNNFPSDETIYQDSINLEDFDNNSIYNMLKSICEKEKESGIKNKIDCTFLINRETPPVLLTKDISLYLINEIDIGKKIKNILNNESYLKNNAIEMIEKELINKEDIKSNDKKNREKQLFNKKKEEFIDISKNKFGKGRKAINDETIRNHNKYSSDNVINKIKTILKKYIIIFINNIINYLYPTEKRNLILSELKFPANKTSDLIKDVDYKSTANKKKRIENLILLNFSLKQLLSFDLSKKYKSIKQKSIQFLKFNQKIITEYLMNDNNHRAIFNFVLNELKIEDFLDIFIYKKELSDISSFNELDIHEKEIVESCFVRIEPYLKELLDGKDYIYLICFLLLIFNYRRYFDIKADRKRKKAEINREITK